MRLALLAAFLLSVVAQAGTPGDLVLRDGAVYTLNDKQPWATTLVIRDGRIAYVGDEAGLKPYLSGARVIDLHGAMVLPGFHDAHIHPMSGGMRLLQCDLSGAKSLQEVEHIIRATVTTKPDYLWMFCNGFPTRTQGSITREKLDAWVPDRPAFVRTTDGFVAWVNSKALKAAGIDPEGTAPEIQGLLRDPKTFKPQGEIMGDAVRLVRGKAPPPTEAEYREALRRVTTMENSQGITSLFDAAATPDMLQAYHDADRAGELTVRVMAAQQVEPDRGSIQVDEMVERRAKFDSKRFHADAAKIFLDGEIDQFTASMRANYANAPQPEMRGPLILQNSLDAMVQDLDAADFLIHMHAMGDGAVRAGLDAVEHAIQKHGPADRRDQIAHLGVVDPADIPRFATLGVIADFTPLWFQQGDAAFLPAAHVLGKRAKWMYPMGSVVATGARVTIGSDWPQETLNPLDEIQYAVTRQPLDGSQPSPQPEQRISVAQAIVAYTKDAAWAVREDKLDGTLEVGKAADIVVLDQDLFEIDVMSIHKAHVLLTLLDGTPVYRNPQFSWPQ